MSTITRAATVPFTAEQMYRLVDDVAAYPQFLPWCDQAQVHSRSSEWVEASIGVASLGFRQFFTTRNHLTPFSRIDLQLVEGPFKKLEGHWRFNTISDGQCQVSLVLDYDYSAGWAHFLFAPFFTHAANELVDAFCQRAKVVYAGAG